MSLTQRQGTGSEPSSGLGLNLSSNNPFRNRATSPANSIPSPVTGNFTNPPERPTSENPFLDQSEKRDSFGPRIQPGSPQKNSLSMENGTSPTKPVLSAHAAELFDNLSMNDVPTVNGNRSDMPPPFATRPIRSENVPPNVRKGPSSHHVSYSQEEDRRMRNGVKPRGPQEELNIFADPPDPSRTKHRLRRNSESSIASKLVNTEEEMKRRERHRRERDARHKDGKGRPPGSKSKKPAKKLDIIDSLDVTSIYGTGLFHHDGPFDACNPDRNRKGSRRAPMQAFDKNSANMILGGSGPVHKDIDFDKFHGRGAEGFTDFSTSGSGPQNTEPIPYEPIVGPSAPPVRNVARVGPGGPGRQSSFDPIARAEQVHGEESLGLGTSTFLDGAPAPRAAIQRRESESDVNAGNGGGLGRKRSLAQKIRGINGSRHGRVTSPENAGQMYRSNTNASPPGESQSAGGMPRIHENNDPFFNDYDEAYEKKGARIQIAETQNRTERSGSIGSGEEEFNAAAATAARSRAMSSPQKEKGAILERRVTNDGTTSGLGESAGSSGAAGGGGGGGFLSRVKSLKSGKKGRPDRVG